jgi:hypothetical protein
MADKHYRLDSKFSSVAAFWKPEAPDPVMTGNLAVDDDGIRFTTSPEYASGPKVKGLDLDQINLPSIPRTPVLHGFFQEENCTLLELIVVEHPGLTLYNDEPQSIVSTAYSAAVFVSGMHTGALDDKCLDRARYTFSSLAEWVNTPMTEIWGEKQITITIPFEKTLVLDFCLPETQVRVQLKVHQELATDKETHARKTKPVAVVEITPQAPESLSWFMSMGNRLENLFSLLSGTSLGMETLFIYRGERSGILIRKQHDFASRYSALESVRHTNSQLAGAMAIWLSESEGFRAIENLVLGVLRKGKLFVETEFLSLAQALEGFHRVTGEEEKVDKASFRELRGKIAKFLEEQNVDEETAKRVNSAVSFSNQTSFRSRSRELCNRINAATLGEMQIAPEEFIDSVLRMRNLFTHAGGSSDERKEPLEGRELFLLNQKMRALLRGVFLLHLGFPENQFQDLIVREATKWR